MHRRFYVKDDMLPHSDRNTLYETFMSGGVDLVKSRCTSILKRLSENFQAHCFHDMNLLVNLKTEMHNMMVFVPLHDTEVVFERVPFPVKCDLGSIAVSEHPVHNVDNTEMIEIPVFIH